MEVGELPGPMQMKLLMVEDQIQRLGASKNMGKDTADIQKAIDEVRLSDSVLADKLQLRLEGKDPVPLVKIAEKNRQ